MSIFTCKTIPTQHTHKFTKSTGQQKKCNPSTNSYTHPNLKALGVGWGEQT